jgi:hypothetical protein
MRIFIAAVVFAVLVGAAFWWHVAAPPAGGQAADAHGVRGGSGGVRMGPLEQATNRQGRDLADVGVRLTDALACSRLCDIDDRCMAMSFVKTADAASGFCWLKGSVPTPSENAAVVSAVKTPADK